MYDTYACVDHCFLSSITSTILVLFCRLKRLLIFFYVTRLDLARLIFKYEISSRSNTPRNDRSIAFLYFSPRVNISRTYPPFVSPLNTLTWIGRGHD